MGVELWELWCNFMGWCSSMRDLGVVIWERCRFMGLDLLIITYAYINLI